MKPFHYACSVCSTTYAQDDVSYTCPADGGNLDIVIDHIAIARDWSPARIASNPDPSMWRYQALLPVSAPPTNSNSLRTVGGSPLFNAEPLAQRLGLNHVRVKDDGRLPTASIKDRASAVVVVRAIETQVSQIITASTGNAGVALAGMAAAAGLQAVILVPESAPQAKVAQLLVFGAQLALVRGSYSDAYDLTLAASKELGCYCRNTGYNPYTSEGKKTVSFEICEQLTIMADPTHQNRNWIAPDRIFVPVGDGNIISGIHKGFKDLQTLGWINTIPRLIGVQAKGSSAIAQAFDIGSENIDPVRANTLADSIAADRPSDGLRALRAATETGGAYVTVSDEEIISAMVSLARETAVFAEPAAAASYAGLVKYAQDKDINPDEHLVVLITGNGLKDVQAAIQAVDKAPSIDPTVDEVRQLLANTQNRT